MVICWFVFFFFKGLWCCGLDPLELTRTVFLGKGGSWRVDCYSWTFLTNTLTKKNSVIIGKHSRKQEKYGEQIFVVFVIMSFFQRRTCV